MRTKLRSKVTLLFMTLGLLLAIPAIALADNLQDSITAGSNAKTIATGDANAWENNYFVEASGSGATESGTQCDIPSNDPVIFELNVPSQVTATSADGTTAGGKPKLVFANCGTSTTNTKSVTFSSNDPGTYTINATYVSGGGTDGDTFNENPANLTLTVAGVDSVTPANLATGVAVDSNVTATFVTNTSGTTGPFDNTTFTLVKDGTTTAIPATVSYNSTTKVATLNPHGTSTTNLELGTKYIATISGVSSGGLALETKTWSFTTVAPACTTPAAPVFTTTSADATGSNGWFNAADGVPTIEATSTTAAATITYATEFNGGTKSAYSATAPTLAQGTTKVYAKATDGTCPTSETIDTFKVDTNAPSVNPASVVNSIWRNTSLSQAFTSSDGVSGLADAANDASFTLTASAESLNASTPTVDTRTVYDNAGNSTTRSVSALIDLTNPVISGSDITQTTWRNSALTANFTASDALSGLLNPLDSSFTLTTSGDSLNATTPVTASKTVSDNAGNPSTRTISAFVDSVKPSLGITDSNLASYDVCGTARPVEPSTNPTDALSGIPNGSLTTSWTNNIQPSGLGSYFYNASVSDRAGNTDSYGPKTYSVVAGSAMSSVMQPINTGNTTPSTFKLGSTVPVKFTLSCNGTPINNSVAKLFLSKIDSSSSAVNEPIATNSPDIGNTFRVTDLATGQYQFNLSTKASSQFMGPSGNTVTLGEGTWYLYIQLDGGDKFKAATFDLKK